MFCQTDSHAGIPLDQEAHYIRSIFFRSLVFFWWNGLPHFYSTQAKRHLKLQDMIQQDIFFAAYPFVKHVDLRQVGLTMSNKKA